MKDTVELKLTLRRSEAIALVLMLSQWEGLGMGKSEAERMLGQKVLKALLKPSKAAKQIKSIKFEHESRITQNRARATRRASSKKIKKRNNTGRTEGTAEGDRSDNTSNRDRIVDA